jgi:hypothetical protein
MKKIIAFIACLAATSMVVSAQGTAFTYQGRLNDGGSPANGTYDLQFYLRDALTAGNAIGATNTLPTVPVTNGLFTVTLNFSAGIFTGTNYWLEIGVRTNGSVAAYSTLSPRQAITPAPYAIMANTASNLLGTLATGQLSGAYGNAVSFNNAGNSFAGNGASLTGVNAATVGGLGTGNFWQTGGNAGTTAGVNYVGTTDAQPLYLDVKGSPVLKLFLNGSLSMIGSTVTGTNSVALGYQNAVSQSSYSIIGGGISNSIVGAVSCSVGSGQFNTNNGNFSTIGGGTGNYNNGTNSVIGGGYENNVSYQGTTVGGGAFNIASGNIATVGGGGINTASGNNATIAGGYQNTASGFFTAIGGGESNTNSGTNSVIGGGYENTASNQGTTVGGGAFNSASGSVATVGGGGINTASGDNATVPGGDHNVASGGYSFAAGHYANANHTGSFVWGDDSVDAAFADTAPNQFLIRATGGVGIGTTSPVGKLNIYGNSAPGPHIPANTTVLASGDGFNNRFMSVYGDEAVYVSMWHLGYGDISTYNYATASGMPLILNSNGGNVGIGTVAPAAQLDVVSSSNNAAAVSGTNSYSGVYGRLALSYYTTGGEFPPQNFCGIYGNGNVTPTYTSGEGSYAGFFDGNVNVNGTLTATKIYANGVQLTSDRNAKENFTAVNAQAVLEKVAGLPMTQWNYKTENKSEKHIGPMAQDFHTAFGLDGNDDKHISIIDEGGVALAAIQGLNQKLDEKNTEIQKLKESVDELKKMMQSLAEKK